MRGISNYLTVDNIGLLSEKYRDDTGMLPYFLVDENVEHLTDVGELMVEVVTCY